jgi:hypothetical protein
LSVALVRLGKNFRSDVLVLVLNAEVENARLFECRINRVDAVERAPSVMHGEDKNTAVIVTADREAFTVFAATVEREVGGILEARLRLALSTASRALGRNELAGYATLVFDVCPDDIGQLGERD